MLNQLFTKALVLWNNKLPEEKAKKGTPVYDFFFNTLEPHLFNLIKELGFTNIISKASVGIGTWAKIPWIGICDSKLTKNFTNGLFVTYLLSPDFNTFFLVLMNGVSYSDYDELETKAFKLRRQIIKPEGFDEGIHGELAKEVKKYSAVDKYSKSIVYSKKYCIDNQLKNDNLIKDLNNLLIVYKKYINILNKYSKNF